jgi:DNA-directed RNA polymerase subunit RPC12/RpoP
MADITFNCPYCEQKIEAPEEMAGIKANCPSCQCELQIPNPDEPKPASVPVPLPAPFAPANKSGLAGVGQTTSPPHFSAAKCPSCGGDLQVPDDRDQVKCMYCGGTVITRQAVQLVSGVNVANLMEVAKAAADANNPKEAYDYYTKVLENEPRNTLAWVGKGEAVGWMSTVKDVKTTEMLAAFNNAMNFASEEDKPALRKHCADAINRVTTACYSIARKHVKQFVSVRNVWPDYVKHCGFLISALEVGHLYDPDNKTTIENIIHISADNIKGFSFDPGMFGLMTQKVFVTEKYEALLRAKIDKYTAQMYRFDPGFVKPKI